MFDNKAGLWQLTIMGFDETLNPIFFIFYCQIVLAAFKNIPMYGWKIIVVIVVLVIIAPMCFIYHENRSKQIILKKCHTKNKSRIKSNGKLQPVWGKTLCRSLAYRVLELCTQKVLHLATKTYYYYIYILWNSTRLTFSLPFFLFSEWEEDERERVMAPKSFNEIYGGMRTYTKYILIF